MLKRHTVYGEANAYTEADDPIEHPSSIVSSDSVIHIIPKASLGRGQNHAEPFTFLHLFLFPVLSCGAELFFFN